MQNIYISSMINRAIDRRALVDLLRQFPVVAIIGARQVGKTTLARSVVEHLGGEVTFFDLEDPRARAQLVDPMIALERRRGLVVLDEIQRVPELFQVLRVLADRPSRPASFLVLGSASPELLRQSSESLAGRIAYVELGGFCLADVGASAYRDLWIRGGFPEAFLAASEADSVRWRQQFIRTFLERDLPQLGIRTPSETLRRFWTMLAHYHGQIWNTVRFAASFGVSDPTVRRYLDTLVSTFVVRRLPPWHANLKKRQVKSPKVYLRDTGLLHTLLALENEDDVLAHPQLGASWESFCLEQTVRRLGALPEQCYFWATHGGAELDLYIDHRGQRLGFEFKHTTAPKLTRSMRAAMASLDLTELTVVHAGPESFPLTAGVRAVAAARLDSDLAQLAR